MRVRLSNQAGYSSGWEINTRAALQRSQGKWFPVGEPILLFAGSYNVVVEGQCLGLRGEVIECDYEGDTLLEYVHQAILVGDLRCHHYEHDTLLVIDYIRPKSKTLESRISLLDTHLHADLPINKSAITAGAFRRVLDDVRED